MKKKNKKKKKEEENHCKAEHIVCLGEITCLHRVFNMNFIMVS